MTYRIQVKVRMPEDTRRRIKQEAEKRGLTVNAEILRRLEQSPSERDLSSEIAEKVIAGLRDKIQASPYSQMERPSWLNTKTVIGLGAASFQGTRTGAS